MHKCSIQIVGDYNERKGMTANKIPNQYNTLVVTILNW